MSFDVRGRHLLGDSSWSSKNTLLTLSGYQIDEAERIGQLCYGDMQYFPSSSKAAQTYFNDFDAIAMTGSFRSWLNSPYVESHQRDVAICYTAIAFPKAHDSNEHYYAMYKTLQRGIAPHIGGIDDDTSLAMDTQPYLEKLRSVGRLRKAFVTKQGYVCLGPAKAQLGDVVCVFSASELPWLLRPTGKRSYQLVGDVYIYKHMYRRLFEKEKHVLRKFVLE